MKTGYGFVPNQDDNVEQIVQRGMMQDSITEEIDRLPFKEQEIQKKHRCFLLLANKFQLSGASAAERLHKKARLAILTNLADKNILDFVTATRVKENNRVATYTYLPRGDKSAEKGVVTISKAKYTYIVGPIAEQDTMISTRYAKKVVGYL